MANLKLSSRYPFDAKLKRANYWRNVEVSFCLERLSNDKVACLDPFGYYGRTRIELAEWLAIQPIFDHLSETAEFFEGFDQQPDDTLKEYYQDSCRRTLTAIGMFLAELQDIALVRNGFTELVWDQNKKYLIADALETDLESIGPACIAYIRNQFQILETETEGAIDPETRLGHRRNPANSRRKRT